MMKINIGENLKRLRLKKDLTQEQLAEILGVSSQAISRWENNTTYPDITLLPGIAVFYDTTIDELIGMDEIRKTENINKIHRDVHLLISNNEFAKGITLIREALKLYPNNSSLLLALGETLAHSSDDIKEREEAISLLERALQLSDLSMKAKSTASANLLFLYLKSEKIDKANTLIKSLPHIWESREILMPEVCDGDEYMKELRKSIIKLLTFFSDKIKNAPNRKFAKTPSYIQLGADLEPKENLDEILNLIRHFLLFS